MRRFIADKCTSKTQFNDKHRSLIKKCEENLSLQLQYETDESIRQLIKELDAELESNYPLLLEEFKKSRSKALDDRLRPLIFMFCDKMNARLSSTGVITNWQLEKDLVEVEANVLNEFEVKNHDVDAVLYSNISTKVIN